MMSYYHIMKTSRISVFMYVYGSFLFLCLPVISSTNTGIEDHSNDKPSSSSSIVSQPGQISSSTNADVKDHINAEQSSLLPKIPQPGQSFYEVKMQKDENYVIVDKTEFIRKLIDNDDIYTTYKIYFLARPRTFGKTFFLSMVREFLDGKAGLFNSTAIASRGNAIKEDGNWNQRPVIFIDFSALIVNTIESFENTLQNTLNATAEKYGISSTKNRDGVIRWLIQELKSKFNFKVSILVDEYDFPIVTTSKRSVREGIKGVLKIFYSELKAAAFASELWLVLILGVDKLEIFSGAMNGLVNDITFDDKFSSIMGFLTNETEKSFKLHLDRFSKKRGWDTPDTVKKIENRYGGYCFNTENRYASLLNTGSVCSCLRKFKFRDFETKTDALVNIVERMIKERKGIDYFKYHCIKESELEEKYNTGTKTKKYVPLHIEMLCQGYLTIKKYHPNSEEICLSYPNKGIEECIERVLPVELRSRKTDKNQTYYESYRLALKELFLDALDKCDMRTFVDLLISEAFPIVSHSLRYKVSSKDEEFVATRYIFQTLNILELDCSEGKILHDINDGSDIGDLDLVIYAMEKNMPHYAISCKFKKSSLVAMFQLFRYIVTKNVEFERIFDGKFETNVINLLGLVIKNDKDRHKTISEWILIPYTHKDKKIWINKIEASDTGTKLSLSKRLKDQTYFEENKEKFVL